MGLRLNLADLETLAASADRVEDFEESLAQAIRRQPADVNAIVEFFDIPSGDAFDVAPERAISFFKAKGLQPTFSYADMLRTEHDHAFTVAKMMDVDMLGQVRASLDSALANGTSFKEWSDSIIPVLQSGGWWGRKKMLDPLTGDVVVAQLGSPWRLETIFRTNMQSAYAAGHWQEITDQADVAPFLMYDAIDDLRTRPLHASWDRKVLPVSSAWWKTHYPPNGYNCRCGVIQLDAEQVQSLGLEVAKAPPDDGEYLWTNPRTGYSIPVPKGIDPGFDKNSGISYQETAKKLLAEKIDALPKDMQAAAKSASAQAAKALDDAVIAAIKAQEELAAIQARAALARMQAATMERAKQQAALDQIGMIAKGKDAAGAAGVYKVKALQTLKKTNGFLELKPSEQLDQVLALAGDLKQKAELSSKLSLYKKAVLEGKTPSPATVKAFNSLDDAEKAAFLKKIDDEKAVIAAKKAAEEAAAAEAAAKAAAAAAPPPALPTGTPPNPATLTKIGAQKGSNPGGEYLDTDTGVKWYVKQPSSVEIARNEVLAGKLYQLAGVDVPEMHIITLEGKPSIASKIVDGLKKAQASTLAAAPGTAEGFAVDAWLANWDVVGLGFDNLLLRGAQAFRVDTGGALRFRAQGTLKGSAWGDDVLEFESLRSPTPNRQAFEVFGKLTDAQIEDGAVRVLKISEDQIRAVVAQFGPTDARENAALVDRLLARQEFIARRYPNAAKRARQELGQAEAPPPPPARVTAAEQRELEAARVNGFAFSTDSDQIEDHSVVVHTLKRADGSDATRGSLKLLPKASAELLARVQAASGASPSVGLSSARQSILDAIKSINYRADKGNVLDDTVVKKIETMKTNVGVAVKQLDEAIAKAADPTALQAQKDMLTEWSDRVAAYYSDAVAKLPAKKVSGMFPTGMIPDSLDYTAKAGGQAPAGLAWKRISGQYSFETASFDRSFAKQTGGTSGVAGVNLRYEATLPDGTRITYFPHDPNVAFAMQGVVRIDVPGKGVDATGSVFSSLDQMGLESRRATELDRQHLYVNAYARIALLRKGNALRQFEAISDMTQAGLQQKIALLKSSTGLDVTTSEGWKTIDGVRQAFGHGRAYQLRPDLAAAELDAMNQTHVVFHNPQGLGWDSGSGVFERLKSVIEGGGMFASLTDRVRRGVPLAGSSVSSDLASGGGDYHFTRLGTRTNARGTGLYWRTSVLRRMDAITYQGDTFGRTTGTTVEDLRQGQTIASLKSTAWGSGGSSSNETIFKGGLSIFDDLDRIVLSSETEVRGAIAWMKSKGYSSWPDGRKLEEVIITKATHGKPKP